MVKARVAGADVGEVGEAVGAGTRCSRCSAAVRRGAPWCTQCYAPAGTSPSAAVVQPAPALALVPAPAPPPVGGLRVAERTAAPPSTGSWPCGACSLPNELSDAACAACGTPFLAAVRERLPTVVLPVLGDLTALSQVRRTALAVGVVLAFLVLTGVLGLLLA